MNFSINPPRRVSLSDLIKQRDKERGFIPRPLDRDLLIKRVKAGGHSGQFLADAFLSAYRTDITFKHSLGELIHLDAQATKLFFDILTIRLVPNWSDSELYYLEHDIKILMDR